MSIYLNGVNVVSDANQFGFLALDELSDVIDTIFDHNRFLLSVWFTSRLPLCKLSESSFLLCFRFRSVFVQQLEELSGYK